MPREIIKLLKYLWASPATLLGLLFVPLAVLGGGAVRVVDGVIEAHGGVVTRILKRGFPFLGRAAAMTLGHVVLGCDPACLEKSRSHERVHVRQYERWGPLFIPLYLGASLLILLRGGDPYGDNPFEKEAFEKTM